MYTLDVFNDQGIFERTLEATEEQTAIIDYALAHPTENILVESLAGSAKTSTLQFLCKYLSTIGTLSVAFNRRIADKMAKVLPGHVRSATANSVCHRVWGSTIGKRLTVDTKKNFNLVREAIDNLPKYERGPAWDSFGDIVKAIARAKLQGYVPSGVAGGRSLIGGQDFFGSLDEEPESWFIRMVNDCLVAGIRQAYTGLIDYDDQVYQSVLFGGSFPSYPRVLVDEAQDFSPLNHAMLERLVGRSTQLIAVGDPWQSIYAFRGADTRSMDWLRQRFSMHKMTLSVSFRCPIAVVERARSRVPHMKYPVWASQGHVEELASWNASSIPDDSAIICRNNAPLMSCALSLLKAGRGVRLVGTDLGPSLIKTLNKLGNDPQLPQEQVLIAIDRWEAEKLRKARDAGSIVDRAECLRIFAGFGPTLGAAVAYCEHIFNAKGPIQLLSGHKSKGLEWSTVYHLDPDRIPSPYSKGEEALEQESNIRYVIETRAKNSLFLVKLEGLCDA